MATCLTLGQKGRFGNQLFQIAATYVHSLRMGEPCVLPRWDYTWLFPNWSLRTSTDVAFSKTWKEPWLDQGEDPVVLPPLEPALNLEGHFLSEQFFAGYEREVRRLFWQDLNVLPPVGVHVRRGDFLNPNDHHLELPVEWYWRAMDAFPGQEFLLVSDDIAWCREQFKGPQFVFSNEPDDINDWRLLCSCRNLITANSTFSWWAGYVLKNPTGIVVCPARWHKYPKWNSYLYAKGWTVVL